MNFEDVAVIRKVMIALIVFNFGIAFIRGDIQKTFGLGTGATTTTAKAR